MRVFLVLAVLFFFSGFLSAQESIQPTITAAYQDQSLSSVIEDLEEKYDLRFYFRSEWIENIVVSGSFESSSVEETVTQLLSGTDIKFILSDPSVIILLKTPPRITESQDAEESVVVFDDPTDLSPTATLNGYIREGQTGEGLFGATIFVRELKTGTSTNEFGYYSLTLPKGQYTIDFAFTGYENSFFQVRLRSSGEFNVDLFKDLVVLEEVMITGESVDQNIQSLDIGRSRLNIGTISNMPPLLGEVDIVKSLTLLPGVTTVGEGASGFNVRGGSVDQNLILLDDIPVFNPSHVFGLFTSFNPDLVRDVTLYKGGIPSEYGGRISSVLDIRLKEGNSKKISARGGIGMISSRLMIEGPIVEDKLTFVVGGRGSYSDWILRQIPDPDLRKSSAYFYDANAKLTYDLSSKDRIMITGYASYDEFKLALDTAYEWSNRSGSFKWNRILGRKLFAQLTATMGEFDYGVNGTEEFNAFELDYGIRNKSLSLDLNYNPEPDRDFQFGISNTWYNLKQGEIKPAGESSISPVELQDSYSRESAAFIDAEIRLTDKLSVMGGLRYSFFQNLGPGTVFQYDPERPRSTSSIVDSTTFNNGEMIQTYHGAEPRLSLRYSLNETSSLKIGYARLRQYLHLISNTTAITPFDIWQNSNTHIKPLIGDQVSAGYFRNFNDNTIETSVEGYFKYMQNFLDYKDGADLILNNNLETELLAGRGIAWGVEMLVKKNSGRLTGWVGYTFSRTFKKITGPTPEEEINSGKAFPANYDKPNDLTTALNYQVTRRLSFGTNFTYSTGRPLTAPTAKYAVDGFVVAHYSDRNQLRIPDYHRLDISLTFKGSHRKQKVMSGDWILAVYNLYARKNAYSIFFQQREGLPAQSFRLSVIGVPIPSITYNFEF